MSNPAFYFDALYPLQDQMLSLIRQIETGFTLSGGTAASRGYLDHRFSDGLDMFVNDDPLFGLWAERVIQALIQAQAWKVTVGLREERLARLTLAQGETAKNRTNQRCAIPCGSDPRTPRIRAFGQCREHFS